MTSLLGSGRRCHFASFTFPLASSLDFLQGTFEKIGIYPVNFQIAVSGRVILNDMKGLELLDKIVDVVLAYKPKKKRKKRTRKAK
jgi:hypothetical protein